jgi:hypothetical protein
MHNEKQSIIVFGSSVVDIDKFIASMCDIFVIAPQQVATTAGSSSLYLISKLLSNANPSVLAIYNEQLLSNERLFKHLGVFFNTSVLINAFSRRTCIITPTALNLANYPRLYSCYASVENTLTMNDKT